MEISTQAPQVLTQAAVSFLKSWVFQSSASG